MPGAEKDDLRWLAPGQKSTKRFPVTGEHSSGRMLTPESWSLHVAGEVETPRVFSFDEIQAMPQEDLRMDIHCVTSWSRADARFTGVRLKRLIENGVAPKAGARFVHFLAYSDRDHDTSMPVEVAVDEAWLIHSVDGEPLTPEHGYPLRVVLPGRYFYKSLKWVHRITFLKEDRLGFWERESGYHNEGDPWKEQRFDESYIASDEATELLRDCADFDSHRKQVFVKAELANWQPASLDLHGMEMKACVFRGGNFQGANFSGANLTLSKFKGANLEGADFSGADLEGADFSGAHLAGAKFSDNCFSATTFESKGKHLASYEGMTVVNPSGLLESQESYLREIGVLV